MKFYLKIFNFIILGGWQCAKLLSLIREHRLSAAIFAPGWVCENFPNTNCLIGNSLHFWALLSDYIYPHPLTYFEFSTRFNTGICEEGSMNPDEIDGEKNICYRLHQQELQPFYVSSKATTDGVNFSRIVLPLMRGKGSRFYFYSDFISLTLQI
jgi:mannosyl-glycoprotein endo-beta-N-acetylglucosaminidase